MKKMKISSEMKECADNCKYRNGERAYDHASTALDKLIKLLKNKNNLISRMSNGQCPSTGSRLDKTMKQMLDSMMGRMGRKGSSASGGGSGEGNIDDGYTGSGKSPLNIPVIGPKRHSLKNNSAGSSASNGPNGRGRNGRGFGVHRANKETMNITDHQKRQSDHVDIDEVPSKYKEAVKIYFGGK